MRRRLDHARKKGTAFHNQRSLESYLLFLRLLLLLPTWALLNPKQGSSSRALLKKFRTSPYESGTHLRSRHDSPPCPRTKIYTILMVRPRGFEPPKPKS